MLGPIFQQPLSRCGQSLLSAMAMAMAVAMLTACSSPPSAAVGPLATGPASLEEWVASEAARLGAREFPVTRLQTQGDVDGDGQPDQVWVYRLDGRGGLESFEQSLAVHLSSNPRRIRSLQVGKSGGRSISGVRVVQGNMELNAQEYLPTDQSCCPTGHATLHIGLRAGQLELLTPTP
ncbi:MAG: hypothetical protein JNN07_28390 [Verrucomicrobiales bacterium]|nr:hypothetical protein [Verrucomicrobiales bacterium]